MNKKFRTLNVLLAVSFIIAACASPTPSATPDVAVQVTMTPQIIATLTKIPTAEPIDPMTFNGQIGRVSVSREVITLETETQIATVSSAVAWSITHSIKDGNLTDSELRFLSEGEKAQGLIKIEQEGKYYRIILSEEVADDDITREDEWVINTAKNMSNDGLYIWGVETEWFVNELDRLTNRLDPENFSPREACRLMKVNEWIWRHSDGNFMIPEECQNDREALFMTYDEYKATHGIVEYPLPDEKSALMIFTQPEDVIGNLWCASLPGMIAIHEWVYARANNDGPIVFSARMMYLDDVGVIKTIPVPIDGWIAIGPNIRSLDPTYEWNISLYDVYSYGDYQLNCNNN